MVFMDDCISIFVSCRRMETLHWTWSDSLRRFIVSRVCSARVCSDALTSGFFNDINIMLELWMKTERLNGFQMLIGERKGHKHALLDIRDSFLSSEGVKYLFSASSLMCRWPLVPDVWYFHNHNVLVIVGSYCVWLPLVKREELWVQFNGMNEWMKCICPCFTPSRIALTESAREIVSLPRFGLKKIVFLVFVSCKRLYDIITITEIWPLYLCMTQIYNTYSRLC